MIKETCYLCDKEVSKFEMQIIDNEVVCLCVKCLSNLKEIAVKQKKLIKKLMKEDGENV